MFIKVQPSAHDIFLLCDITDYSQPSPKADTENVVMRLNALQQLN